MSFTKYMRSFTPITQTTVVFCKRTLSDSHQIVMPPSIPFSQAILFPVRTLCDCDTGIDYGFMRKGKFVYLTSGIRRHVGWYQYNPTARCFTILFLPVFYFKGTLMCSYLDWRKVEANAKSIKKRIEDL